MFVGILIEYMNNQLQIHLIGDTAPDITTGSDEIAFDGNNCPFWILMNEGKNRNLHKLISERFEYNLRSYIRLQIFFSSSQLVLINNIIMCNFISTHSTYGGNWLWFEIMDYGFHIRTNIFDLAHGMKRHFIYVFHRNIGYRKWQNGFHELSLDFRLTWASSSVLFWFCWNWKENLNESNRLKNKISLISS